jgi:hypothetical protein
MVDPSALREEILRLTREYSRQVHGAFRPAADPERTPWQNGTTIPYAGRVFTEDEVEAAVSSTLDFWLTLGSEGEAFPKGLAAFMGVRHSLVVNSGSSANLIAISALTSARLPPERRLQPEDEVITVAETGRKTDRARRDALPGRRRSHSSAPSGGHSALAASAGATGGIPLLAENLATNGRAVLCQRLQHRTSTGGQPQRPRTRGYRPQPLPR